MATGRPDYTSTTVIRGLSPTDTLIPVALDAAGNLVAVAKGTDGVTLHTLAVDAAGRIIMVPYGIVSVSGDVNATPTTTVRQVQGADGATYRTLAVDASGQMIMVPRGQSGNYMSVDSAGFLSAVMKGVDGVTLRTIAVDASGKILGVLQGDYAGALKTLAVDSQGRMLAVLTDPEDVFGNPHYMGAAELAVRLGSIASHDRRGTVIHLESFEAGANYWILGGDGSGGTVALSTACPKSGSYSVAFTFAGGTATWGAVTSDFTPRTSGRSGMEASFQIRTGMDRCVIALECVISGYKQRGSLQIDLPNQRLQYLDSTGNWQTIATNLAIPYSVTLWTTLKLVIDFTTLKYVRGIMNDTEYDLSAYSLQNTGSSSYKYNFILVQVFRVAGQDFVVYLDDVIITQAEP